eukprot:scaffold129809_cov39-Tisochrysis_lutea.AAC.2
MSWWIRLNSSKSVCSETPHSFASGEVARASGNGGYSSKRNNEVLSEWRIEHRLVKWSSGKPSSRLSARISGSQISVANAALSAPEAPSNSGRASSPRGHAWYSRASIRSVSDMVKGSSASTSSGVRLAWQLREWTRWAEADAL